MAEAGAGSPHGGDAAAPGPPEEQELSRRLRRLYPAVNQEETPLPRSWSPKDKYNYIGLSQGNLRVHYKGAGSRRLCSRSLGRDGTGRLRYPRGKGCGVPGCGSGARGGRGGLRAAGRGAVPALRVRGSRRCGPSRRSLPCTARRCPFPARSVNTDVIPLLRNGAACRCCAALGWQLCDGGTVCPAGFLPTATAPGVPREGGWQSCSAAFSAMKTLQSFSDGRRCCPPICAADPGVPALTLLFFPRSW